MKREITEFQKYHAIIQNPKYPRLLKLLLGALACVMDVMYLDAGAIG
jgi:hypothetical protein